MFGANPESEGSSSGASCTKSIHSNLPQHSSIVGYLIPQYVVKGAVINSVSQAQVNSSLLFLYAQRD